VSQHGDPPGQTAIPITAAAGSASSSRYARCHERVRARDPGLFYDLMWWLTVRPLLATRRVRAIDADRVPASSAVILAPNHTTYADHLLVAGVSGRRLSFMAKSALFDGGLRFVTWLGAFPVMRGAHDREAIQTALDVLERGGCLVMYCEGTMSRDGMPRQPAKPGIGRLALQTGAPIVPLAILGAPRPGRLRFPRITIRFGEPLHVVPTEARSRVREQQIADEVLVEITRLHKDLLARGRALTRRPAVTTGSRWPGFRRRGT